MGSKFSRSWRKLKGGLEPPVFSKIPWILWQWIASYTSQQDAFRLASSCSFVYVEHGKRPLHSAELSLVHLVAQKQYELCHKLLTKRLVLGKLVNLEVVDFGTLPFDQAVFRSLRMNKLRELVWVFPCVEIYIPDGLELGCRSKVVAGKGPRLGCLQLDKFQVGPVFIVSWFIADMTTLKCLTLTDRTWFASPPFAFAGYVWSAIIFVNGNQKYTELNQVSIYIRNETMHLHNDRSFRAKFGITVVHPTESTRDHSRQAAEDFDFGSCLAPGPYDRGWHNTIAWDRIIDQEFLDKDTLHVRLELRPHKKHK